MPDDKNKIELMENAPPDKTLNPQYGSLEREPTSWKGWHETAHVDTAEAEREEFADKAKKTLSKLPSEVPHFSFNSTLKQPFLPEISSLMSPEDLAKTSAGHSSTTIVNNTAHPATTLTAAAPLAAHMPVLAATHPAAHPNLTAAHHHAAQLSASDGKTMIEPKIEGQHPHHHLIADIAQSVHNIFHRDPAEVKQASQPKTLTAAQAIVGPIFHKLASADFGPHKAVLSAKDIEDAARNPDTKRVFAKAGIIKGVAYYTAIPAKAVPATAVANNLAANNRDQEHNR